ncbi:MAG: hypothetical protein PVI11_02585 [Candidatus Aminicenantes bacterium]|jgi:hypothetical protein
MKKAASSQKNKFSLKDQRTLRILDKVVTQKSVRAAIDSLIPKAEQKLAADSEAILSWEPVPLELYGGKLPDVIHSSWVFVIRAASESGAERHPNSHQYMMSYRGTGDLQIKTDKKWESNLLVSDPVEKLESRWVSIPPYTWHQAVTSKENWAVVSFHTAHEDELIEERPDSANTQSTHQRLYLDEQ